jgi:TolB-like protein
VEPTAQQVREQLSRMLASEPFANADRLSRFLRYVVERTLDGESDQLKEYAVGVSVFDRSEQYDPRVDSIVRVEAGRLRTKIDEYYRSRDGSDAIVIRLPKGSYAPVFELRSGATAQSVPPSPQRAAGRNWRWPAVALAVALVALVAVIVWPAAPAAPPGVSIAVLPFEVFSNAPDHQLLAARLTDGVTSELARLGTVSVVSRTSAQQFAGARRSIREMAQALGAALVLEGSVEAEGEVVRVNGRLVDAAIDRKIWVEEFVGQVGDLGALQRRIAVATTAAIDTRQKAQGTRQKAQGTRHK